MTKRHQSTHILIGLVAAGAALGIIARLRAWQREKAMINPASHDV